MPTSEFLSSPGSAVWKLLKTKELGLVIVRICVYLLCPFQLLRSCVEFHLFFSRDENRVLHSYVSLWLPTDN